MKRIMKVKASFEMEVDVTGIGKYIDMEKYAINQLRNKLSELKEEDITDFKYEVIETDYLLK